MVIWRAPVAQAAVPQVGVPAGVTMQAKVRLAARPAGGSKLGLVAPAMLVHPMVLVPVGAAIIPFWKCHW